MENTKVQVYLDASAAIFFEPNTAYVDKTGYIEKLLEPLSRKYSFIRPRRFGKTAFLDTLTQFFMGDRNSFRGLSAGNLDISANSYRKRPVIMLSLQSLNVTKWEGTIELLGFYSLTLDI